MSHIDVFKTYEDLLASGIPEAQAKAQVRALDDALSCVATKDDLANAISGLEKDLKIYFGQLVRGTMFITFLVPVALAIILKVLRLV